MVEDPARVSPAHSQITSCSLLTDDSVSSRYQPPFDRHDWTIDRNGKRIRYVIDFYTGRGGAGAGAGAGLPPQLAFYLDVRPALDNFEGVKMRVRRSLNKLFGLGSPSHQHLTGNSDRSTVQRVNS